MKFKLKKSGSVMVVVLIIIGLTFFLFEKLIRTANEAITFSSLNYRQAQAKLLAQSGLRIAMAQLENAENGKFESSEELMPGITKTTKEEVDNPTIDDRLKTVYQGLLPTLNLWQTFELKNENDQIDAQIKICITSEEGKINFLQAFDYEKEDFKDEFKQIFESFKVNQGSEQTTILELIKKHIKEKNKKLNDLTELDFTKGTKPFYEPREIQAANKQVEILDLFTFQETAPGINPLLLSASVRKILSLSAPLTQNNKEKEKEFKEIYEILNFDFAKNIENKLEQIEQLYLSGSQETDTKKDESKQGGIEKLKSVLSKQIEPKYFSVLSYAMFEGVAQKMFAIISKKENLQERYVQDENENKNPENKENKNEKNTEQIYIAKNFDVIRVYWT